MIAKQLLAVLLSIGVSASPLALRDASTVLADLSSILDHLSTLSTTVANFDGTLTGAVSVQQDEMTLSDALNKTVIDLTASPVFGAADSTSVTKAVTGLETSIVTVLDKIIGKKSLFASAGVTSVVLSDLETLQGLTDDLSTQLQRKVTAADASTIASEAAQLDAVYTVAISAFS
ncbi:hypothetical protein ALT_2854 [Aspergillus lentulus]|uniref:Cell wall mannoprotein 1 n=1 Tax=Aspergillus lentulus TaxID=293939 RepID=A0AAN5YSN7_ASPLE|nr:uncharacterized protein IFM58399_04730 [Aspergillus lentulus]KAF4158584.1 hypothetical protein CNMCM6069_003970 [Aspergillus lentulus]KAF4161018.1 hypothetical protein CNMCM6936_003627 [Aspergillus lentulus]KAF4174201.1 hypothetical protein CNMCM8060_008942 [Aspergillus lentulus]KAF4182599.1 hypothetical protein CNMCM7927_009611 [Aspergillus lentulus]KAF4193172.1 hypothetical protein CNMCM8694_009173 [Aspergillus lentulus]